MRRPIRLFCIECTVVMRGGSPEQAETQLANQLQMVSGMVDFQLNGTEQWMAGPANPPGQAGSDEH